MMTVEQSASMSRYFFGGLYYRVVEINKAYDPHFGYGKGWIYVTNAIFDYKHALIAAIEHEKQTGNKTYVEALRA